MSTDGDAGYQGPDLPRRLGEGLRVALDLERRPRNFGEYVDAMAVLVEQEGLQVDLAVLCTTDESPHRATFRGQTKHYHCALDAIIVPFIADEAERVTIETVSPLSGNRIMFIVTHPTIIADPPETVLSFGIAADIGGQLSNSRSPALAYRRVCPYSKAFTSHAEYEQWAEAADAHTIPITLQDGLELARALGQVA